MIAMAVSIMVGIGSILLLAAGALTVVRMSRGPSSLDRVVAADVLVAVVIAGLALEAIINRHTTTLPVMLVLSLLGFAGSVSIARFVADRDTAGKWNVPDPHAERVDPRPEPVEGREGEHR
jgi:multicomponent Na+:H+ antiporter subunit F